MYLGAKSLIENGDKQSGVLLSEQMTIAEIMLNGLMHLSDQTEEVVELSDDITEIIETYNSFPNVSDSIKNSNGEAIELNEKELDIMAKKIISLRESIVQ